MVSVREKAGESHSQNPVGDEEYKMAKKNINFVKSVVIIAIGAALYGFGGLSSATASQTLSMVRSGSAGHLEAQSSVL